MQKIKCPKCGQGIEVIESEKSLTCTNCGAKYKNPFYVEPMIEMELEVEEENDLSSLREELLKSDAQEVNAQVQREQISATKETNFIMPAVDVFNGQATQRNSINCSACGAQILVDADTEYIFCSKCGKKHKNPYYKQADKNAPIKKMVCPNCGAIINNYTSSPFKCEFCGSQLFLDKNVLRMQGMDTKSLGNDVYKHMPDDLKEREKYIIKHIMDLDFPEFLASFDKQISIYEKRPAEKALQYIIIFLKIFKEKADKLDIQTKTKIQAYAILFDSYITKLSQMLKVPNGQAQVSTILSGMHVIIGNIMSALEINNVADYDCVVFRLEDFIAQLKVGAKHIQEYYYAKTNVEVAFLLIAIFIMSGVFWIPLWILGLNIVATIVMLLAVVGTTIAVIPIIKNLKNNKCSKCGTLLDINANVKYEEAGTINNKKGLQYKAVATCICPDCGNTWKIKKKITADSAIPFDEACKNEMFVTDNFMGEDAENTNNIFLKIFFKITDKITSKRCAKVEKKFAVSDNEKQAQLEGKAKKKGKRKYIPVLSIIVEVVLIALSFVPAICRPRSTTGETNLDITCIGKTYYAYSSSDSGFLTIKFNDSKTCHITIDNGLPNVGSTAYDYEYIVYDYEHGIERVVNKDYSSNNYVDKAKKEKYDILFAHEPDNDDKSMILYVDYSGDQVKFYLHDYSELVFSEKKITLSDITEDPRNYYGTFTYNDNSITFNRDGTCKEVIGSTTVTANYVYVNQLYIKPICGDSSISSNYGGFLVYTSSSDTTFSYHKIERTGEKTIVYNNNVYRATTLSSDANDAENENRPYTQDDYTYTITQVVADNNYRAMIQKEKDGTVAIIVKDGSSSIMGYAKVFENTTKAESNYDSLDAGSTYCQRVGNAIVYGDNYYVFNYINQALRDLSYVPSTWTVNKMFETGREYNNTISGYSVDAETVIYEKYSTQYVSTYISVGEKGEDDYLVYVCDNSDYLADIKESLEDSDFTIISYNSTSLIAK